MNKGILNTMLILIITTSISLIMLACIPPAICNDNSGWTINNTPNASLSETELELISLINDYRRDNERDNLLEREAQSVSAQRHANDMANRDYFDYVTLVCGWDSMDRADSAGTVIQEEIYARDKLTAENAFIHFKSDDDANTALLGNFTTIGIGEKDGYWVLNFN